MKASKRPNPSFRSVVKDRSLIHLPNRRHSDRSIHTHPVFSIAKNSVTRTDEGFQAAKSIVPICSERSLSYPSPKSEAFRQEHPHSPSLFDREKFGYPH